MKDSKIEQIQKKVEGKSTLDDKFDKGTFAAIQQPSYLTEQDVNKYLIHPIKKEDIGNPQSFQQTIGFIQKVNAAEKELVIQNMQN